MSKGYVILTTSHKDLLFGGNVHLFWGENSCGYTAILQRAGVYTEEEALDIYRHGKTEIPIQIEKFNMQDKLIGSISKEDFVQFPILFSKGRMAYTLVTQARKHMDRILAKQAEIGDRSAC